MEGNTPSTSTVTREDACATLLYHIAKHFIGQPKLFQDRSLQILNNLSCPNLDKFIHYEHAFLSKVMIGPDCNLDFWKERFISGLPPLFQDKVRTKIQDRNNGNIPYGNLTYGDFLKKEQSSSRKELGSYCRNFGFITPPDKINKDKREKSHRKKSRRRYDSTRPKKMKSRSKRPNDAKVDVCWTCGKTDHKANECRSKTKKKKINLLNIDEETKGKLLAILDEPFSESSGAFDEYSDDEDIDLDYDSDASQSGKDCTCTEAFCTCDITHQIRVLSDHSKEALFDVIQHINDNEDRNHTLSEPSISDLRHEVSSLQEDIKNIKSRLCIVETDILTNQVPKGAAFHDLESNKGSSHEDLGDNIGIDLSNINNDHSVEPFVTNTGNDTSSSAAPGVTVISSIRPQSHHKPIKIVVSKHFVINKIALLDSGAYMNCIVKGTVPTKYLQKSTSKLYSATGEPLKINHKLSKAHICNNGISLTNDFVITENINEDIILGMPFITQIKPYFTDLDGITTTILGKDLPFPFVKTLSQDESNSVRENTVFKINNLSQHITFLKDEIRVKKIEQVLKNPEIVTKIAHLQEKFEKEICSDFPNAFWERKKHIVDLPYIERFNEQDITTKARPIQMNHETMEFYKKEIDTLFKNKIIRISKSPWSCSAFYVNKNAEKESGAPRLLINYKPLNFVSKWFRYPIPNKRDLLKRTFKANIYSKFDMKSGFWQILISEKDKYITAFNVPFGQYEWTVMPFGLKNAPPEFQNIMNSIFNDYSYMSIVYTDDVLIFSENIDSHFKHLNSFFKVIKNNGLVVSAKKMVLFQTTIRFLGHDLYQGTYKPICRAIEFSSKFPNEIPDKTQLQRFLGSLNYVADFIPKVRQTCEPLYKRLRKNPVPWSTEQTEAVIQVKALVQTIPCLGIPNPDAFMIVETVLWRNS
ncbi:uncharacterized protein LOC125842931 [Solanum stenotomum]|uniref:uncharacterized protein LOC125842931 n=1 Tax=Solanum stenotomum TaxID=172797 RepID=UPI0020D0853A|nr:uncharacterized protein LOC125842931 [Solanum stenotomum]